ncbi:uncharacterized protein [Phaseolus vulgaris]|uniref:uncharacterized protein n=1 Tax=Phaseolus vulgaris TaxID=3885 RepID=UPI0035C9A417
MWEPLSAKLKTIAEDIPAIITRAVESSTTRLQDDLFTLKTENSTIRVEVEKLSANLTLAEIEHSRIELESKIVPYRVRVADLEALIKADAVKVKKLEQRSADRETLLGKVTEDLLQAQELNEQLKKQVEELEQQNKGLKEQAKELEKQIEELKKQIEDLNLSSAQILAARFEAAREQFACLFPDLDLSMVSLNNEVVDGKVVPAED